MRKVGFTLVELIVVIAIIALLSATIAPNAFRAIEKAKVTKAAADIRTIAKAMEILYSDTGDRTTCINAPPHCAPIMRNGCCAVWGGNTCCTKTGSLPGWDGPYLEGGRGADMTPWGGTYLIQNGALTCVAGYPLNLVGGARGEIWIDIDNLGFNNNVNGAAPMPLQSAQMMDLVYDDNNLATGNIGRGGSASSSDPSDVHWVISVDVEPTSCW
ncbi:MAG TPA: prepilin-type N-terminal cleavage/methylation domain-containing protein [Candidatus Omnitrophota bacterium]|nr:prepilin-type N-terminal cleavage/methylation domain-containing protein [Candidatus Omnitrophota bacterium]HRZ14607.1 prepilin-type N-terminal cleavage/methylation domain-containing protein [Candidatus Omnitrophota bacterium]